MTDTHSPLPWSYDGHEHFSDNGGRYREVKDARGDDVVGEYGSVSHENAELMVDATHAYRLLADGWSVAKVSLYDEEGVDGWQWTRGYEEYSVIGAWDELPPIPDELLPK